MLPNLEKVIDQMGLKANDCHPALPRDKEFRGLGLLGGAISLEELYFITGVIATVKPDIVIELGTAYGGSVVGIASVLKDFGKGEVITVDIADVPPKTARDMILANNLPVRFVTGKNSIDFLNELKVEDKIYLVFSDTDIPLRPTEVKLALDKLPKGTLVIVHDTSDKHPRGPMDLKNKLGNDYNVVELPTPRGIAIVSKNG